MRECSSSTLIEVIKVYIVAANLKNQVPCRPLEHQSHPKSHHTQFHKCCWCRLPLSPRQHCCHSVRGELHWGKLHKSTHKLKVAIKMHSTDYTVMNLLQLTPFPEYPVLQEQLKLPTLFVQFAFTSQLWTPSTHSSTSASMRRWCSLK